MKKLTLPLHKILDLDREINGFQQTNEKGEVLFSQKGFINLAIPLDVKYKLKSLNNRIDEHKKILEGLRVELIHKYGEKENDERYLIKPEHQEQFNKEFIKIVEQDIDIEVPLIKLSVLSTIVTDQIFDNLFKLVDEEG